MFALRLAALLIAALSLAPSFAHVLEAPPRLRAWPPELWRDTTVFHGQFALFGIVGGPIDIAAIAAAAALTFALRNSRPDVWWALAGALLYAASLAVWLSVVNPANGVMAGWRPGPLPPEFFSVRNQWEAGHAVMAGLKGLGLAAIAVAVIVRSHST